MRYHSYVSNFKFICIYIFFWKPFRFYLYTCMYMALHVQFSARPKTSTFEKVWKNPWILPFLQLLILIDEEKIKYLLLFFLFPCDSPYRNTSVTLSTNFKYSIVSSNVLKFNIHNYVLIKLWFNNISFSLNINGSFIALFPCILWDV